MRSWIIGLVFLTVVATGCGNGSSEPDDLTFSPDIRTIQDIFAELGIEDVSTLADADPGPDGQIVEVAEDSVPAIDLTADDLSVMPEVVTQTNLKAVGPDSWQRGPVTVILEVDMGMTGDGFSMEFEWGDGDEFAAATALVGFGDDLSSVGNGEFRFVWDSMADVQVDLDSVRLRARLFHNGDQFDQLDIGPFVLLNDPARERSVLITSSINGNNKVRHLRFANGKGLSYDDEVYEVGESPVAVAFGPGGKTAVTVDQGGKSLTFFSFAENGDLELADKVAADGVNIEVARFSGDGSLLYVLSHDSTPAAGMYRLLLDPHSGLPVAGAELEFISPHFGSGDFDLLPHNQGYVVLAGILGLEGLKLEIRDSTGAEISTTQFGPEGSLSTAVAVSPWGDAVLVSYANLFGAGEAVQLFHIVDPSEPEDMGSVEVVDPDDIVFAPDGISAVVSEAWKNRVTLVKLGGGIALSKLNSVKLDLATVIATPTWGPDGNTFLVCTVSASTGESGLGVVTLDGNAIALESLFSLGGGNDVIPGAVGMSP